MSFVSRLPRPLVWAALGVPIAWVGIDLFNHQILPLLEWGIGLTGLGWLAWQLRKSPQPQQLAQSKAPANPRQVQQTLTETESLLNVLAAVTPNQPPATYPHLQTRLTALSTDLSREQVQITLLGGQGVGKTTLIDQLQAQTWPRPITWQEATLTDCKTLTADLILLVIAADLTQSELECLQHLRQQGQRLMVVWNKQDQFLPLDQQQIWQQLQQHLQQHLPGGLAAADLVAVSAAPAPLWVRQHQTDGTVQEWQEQPLPQLQALQERLRAILTQESQQLVWQHTWQQAQSLKTEVQSLIHRRRRQQALPIVERYQWIAAGTTLVSPLPVLDLVGVGVIAAKMVQELAMIYQQKLSLDQAESLGRALASLILKLGLVEFSTQTLTSLLKTNAWTYLAGAGIQAVSTAYLTRLAGLTLIEHFQALSDQTPETKSPLKEQLRQQLQRAIVAQAAPEVLSDLAQAAATQLPQLPTGSPALPNPPLATIPLPNLVMPEPLPAHEPEPTSLRSH